MAGRDRLAQSSVRSLADAEEACFARAGKRQNADNLLVTCSYIFEWGQEDEELCAYPGVPGGSGSETGCVGTGCMSGGGVCE